MSCAPKRKRLIRSSLRRGSMRGIEIILKILRRKFNNLKRNLKLLLRGKGKMEIIDFWTMK